VIEVDWPELPSMTVLDGPFMSVLPLGTPGRGLLYHVDHAVITRCDALLLDPAWLDPKTSPFASVDKVRWFKTHLDSCREFIPALGECRFNGFVEGPRVVLANRDDTDARPSVVIKHEPGYISVFSGKVGSCLWVADEVVRELGSVYA